MAEGPGKPSHAPATPKAEIEGVCPQSGPLLVSLDFGLSETAMVAFSSVWEITARVEYIELKY